MGSPPCAGQWSALPTGNVPVRTKMLFLLNSNERIQPLIQRVISEITRKRVVEAFLSEERAMKTKLCSDAGIYYRQRVILSETEWSRSFAK